MKNYWKADFYRIGRRIPRIIILVIIFIVCGVLFYKAADGSTPYELVETATQFMSIICTVFAIIEFGSVYVEDMKAKTMLVAVGSGLTRSKCILVKWIETIVLTALDTAVFLVVGLVVSMVKGVIFSGEPLRDLILLGIFAVVNVAGALGFTLIFLYLSLSPVIGVIVFIITCTGILNTLIEALLSIGFINNLHLQQYLFDNLLETAKARAILGIFSVPHILGMAAYLAALYAITYLIFRKKELQF